METTITSERQEKREALFFPGINALRFFAALGVIITHIELLKGAFGFEHSWHNPIIYNLGGLGVNFFFVLSGFLITFLLLNERKQFGKVRIKQFYLRRILRIWPLYYLICFIGFFVLPQFEVIRVPYLQQDFMTHFSTNLLLYLIILPNLAFSLYPAVPHIGQLWSIGIEEQFYIVWPWIISKTKNVLKAMIVLIGIIIISKVIILGLGSHYSNLSWYKTIKNLAAMSKFECMSIGGMGAHYLFIKNESILRLVRNTWIFNLSIVLIPVLILFTPPSIQDGVHIPFSFLFLIIILNVISRKQLLINLETRVFSYLGKISYGIYMYHMAIIPMVLFASSAINIPAQTLWFNLFVYSSTIFLTIAVSSISYHLFEHPFIKLKMKFSFIKSGGDIGD